MPLEASVVVPQGQQSEAAETRALISQITAEARAAGQSIAHDPDAAVSDEDADAVIGRPRAKPGKEPKADKSGRDKSGKFLPKADPEDADSEDDATEGEETEDETEDDDEDKPSPGAFDADAVQAALDAEGGVDMLALAKALGKEPEELGVTPGQHKALRIAQKKANQTLTRANSVAEQLKREYGDRIAARKAVSEDGDLDPAIECCEGIFGMSWNELNKAVAAKLAGKPLPDIEKKRQERETKKQAEAREAEAKKTNEEKASAEKTEQAKTWIGTKIKGDKLASPELAKTLQAAGLPSVTDMVFEELKRGFSKGLTDPRKALEVVRTKLQKQAKALAAAGLVPVAADKKTPSAVRTSAPRAEAQRGAAGNSREMTDAEIRQSVLKEAGLYRK